MASSEQRIFDMRKDSYYYDEKYSENILVLGITGRAKTTFFQKRDINSFLVIFKRRSGSPKSNFHIVEKLKLNLISLSKSNFSIHKL